MHDQLIKSGGDVGKVMLADLIRNHTAAHAAWKNSVPPADDLPCEGELYDAFCAAELSFVMHQCVTHDEVQAKLSYVAATPIIAEVIETDYQDEFLASLRLPPSAGVTPALADAWETYTAAAIQETLEIANGIAAGKAWSQFLKLFVDREAGAAA